jgi:mRNA-degrading endonuclease toxin of MazEF toxin-antitoxin module
MPVSPPFLCRSRALCGPLRTIDKRRIRGEPIGQIAQADLDAIERAIAQVYGL